MKQNLLLLFITALVFGACNTTPEFTITAELEGIPNDETVFLYDTEKGEDIDSAVVVDGKFEFAGSVDKVSFYLLMYRPKEQRSKYVSVWVENMPINVKGDLADISTIEIEGSPVQDQEKEFNTMVKPLKERIDSISQAYDPNNVEAAKKLYELYEKVNAEIKEKQKEFVKTHTEYFYSVYMLERLIRDMEPTEGEAIFALIPDENKSTSYGKNVARYLALNKNLKEGDGFADLTLNNAEGEPVNLAELAKGKHVLIDFWASWCGPCRRENPHLRKAFEMYQDKGFEIYAVSLDEKKEEWLNAVAEDSITWITVIDTLAFDSDAAMMYSVKYIPHNFLINPEGKILGIDLRGEEFLNKLEEIFE